MVNQIKAYFTQIPNPLSEMVKTNIVAKNLSSSEDNNTNIRIMAVVYAKKVILNFKLYIPLNLVWTPNDLLKLKYNVVLKLVNFLK